MGEGWDFRLLGPLEVRHDGVVVPIAAAKQRILVAALALAGREPVPPARLIECLWGEEPPATARNTLKNYVLRLRRTFEVAGEAGPLVTSTAGYRLDVEADAVDVRRFQAALRAARIKTEETLVRLDEALALWRGQPLADVPSEVLHREVVPGLVEQRLAAREQRIDLDLDRGRHRALVDELVVLTTENPLREGLWARLMLALHRGGRTAEALDAYRRAAEVLAEELGVDPGPELAKLHQAVLANDPALIAERPRAIVPRQLPATTAHFVGRAAELTNLSARLSAARKGIAVIAGTAGVGKTTLAVHWGHQHADRFPDGQLYVNLRGFGGAPVQPATAVRGCLTALGILDIPSEPDDQLALYRTLLAERKVLVVLDNARDAEQVRPLLPGAAGCLVLVTSRDQLAALVALDGAMPLPLDLLPQAEARDLLTRRLGHDRVTRAEAVVDELIEACARLPLALSIVAAQAVLNPTRPLSALADELRDARRRLDVLGAVADVRAVFSWSYHALDPMPARVFRLLGRHPGPDIGLPAAASLTALDLDRTRQALTTLAEAHLITEHAPGRYSMHDLLRAYAADQPDDDSETLRRVVDFYLHTAHAADRLLDPHRKLIPLDPPTAGTQPHPLHDKASVLAWFEVEHANLTAVQQAAVGQGWHRTVWQLAWTVSGYYLRRGLRHDRVALWSTAAAAAEHLDPGDRIRTLRLLGRAQADLGRHEEAAAALTQALTLAEDLADIAQQAHTHQSLGVAWDRRGDHRPALAHSLRARDFFQQLDQPVWLADALCQAGWCAAKLGDHDVARAYCQDALVLYRRHGDIEGEATVLDSLGYIDHHTGRHRSAVDHYQRSIALFREIGDTREVATTLDYLGHPHVALGEPEQARAVWQEALELYRSQGDDQGVDRVRRQLDTLDGR